MWEIVLHSRATSYILQVIASAAAAAAAALAVMLCQRTTWSAAVWSTVDWTRTQKRSRVSLMHAALDAVVREATGRVEVRNVRRQ